jgi:TolA-binding protein
MGRIEMKFKLTLIGASALTICAALSVPATAQDANVEGRVVKLEKEMRAVQRKVFPDSSGKFFEPEIKPETAAKSDGQSSSSSAVGDLIARVDALETQLATLTGTVERQGNTMRSIESRLKIVETQIKEQNMPAPETAALPVKPAQTVPVFVPAKPAVTAKPPSAAKLPAAAKPPTGKPSASRTAAVAAIEKPVSGDTFDNSYTYGYRLWEAKFYPEAQNQLQETITKYAKNNRVSYARNLLGRAWLDDNKPATAVKVFYDNYKTDPRGDRAPDSLYFLGQSLTSLGKNAEACEAYGQLATAYPDAASGRLSNSLSSGRSRAKCK